MISSVAETEKAPLIMRQKGVLVPPESAYLERGAFYHISDVGPFSFFIVLQLNLQQIPPSTFLNAVKAKRRTFSNFSIKSL